MAKKMITIELIDKSTKDELIDIAGRLGIEDKVHYKMLKAELHNLVLTEFLSQQEETQEETEAAAPLDMDADAVVARIRAARLARKAVPVEPEPEPEPEPAPEPEFTYHIVKGGKETIVRDWALYDIRHQLAIKNAELDTLERLALRDGEASVLKLRRVKGRVAKITFIVRAH